MSNKLPQALSPGAEGPPNTLLLAMGRSGGLGLGGQCQGGQSIPSLQASLCHTESRDPTAAGCPMAVSKAYLACSISPRNVCPTTSSW